MGHSGSKKQDKLMRLYKAHTQVEREDDHSQGYRGVQMTKVKVRGFG